ncbi:uncharacterized protein LOC119766427 [Culex quinquefasciatus]|uniref:uncharacterized protein LOC119766427 n=1 Tax=Culex quinquefasciatus TaxID=7176 RepID=UPI0018E3EF7C|nr:uncharacterized protein LOC119766427 [Culex quinquefasciatus]
MCQGKPPPSSDQCRTSLQDGRVDKLEVLENQSVIRLQDFPNNWSLIRSGHFFGTYPTNLLRDAVGREKIISFNDCDIHIPNTRRKLGFCRFCGEVFGSKKVLTAHFLRYSDGSCQNNQLCSDCLTSKKRRHIGRTCRRQALLKICICPLCGSQLTTNRTFTEHVKRHLTKPPSCARCNTVCGNCARTQEDMQLTIDGDPEDETASSTPGTEQGEDGGKGTPPITPVRVDESASKRVTWDET